MASSAERRSRPVFIMTALNNYESQHGHLPPVVIRDRRGTPIHSWRVLLLPQFDLTSVYRRYDQSEPWNGPHNRQLISDVSEYTYTSWVKGRRPGKTNYVAVTGPGTVWAEGEPWHRGKSLSTIWLLEILPSDIEWSEPKDMTVQEAIAYIQGRDSSPWKRPAQLYGMTGLSDVVSIPATASTEVLEALFSTDESRRIPCKPDGKIDFEYRSTEGRQTGK
jgi:hypothetical protein